MKQHLQGPEITFIQTMKNLNQKQFAKRKNEIISWAFELLDKCSDNSWDSNAWDDHLRIIASQQERIAFLEGEIQKVCEDRERIEKRSLEMARQRDKARVAADCLLVAIDEMRSWGQG